MAKGHRSQIKRERNNQKDTRPSAKVSYARVSVQKACFVLDAIRGKDVAMIFQEPMLSLNPLHTAGKQIMELFWFPKEDGFYHIVLLYFHLSY